MQNGMTYIVRPRMQPRYSSVMMPLISAGSIQLLVGPASVSRSEQMKVRSTRATSVGSESARNEFGFFFGVEPREGAGRDQLRRSAAPTPRRSRRRTPPGRAGQLGDLLDPGEQPLVRGRCGVQTGNGR